MKQNSREASGAATKKERMTINKQIANAPTQAKKLEIALNRGAPPTPIQRFVQGVVGLDGPLPDGVGNVWKEWQDEAIKRSQAEFVKLFFFALMRDDPRPFEELLQALADGRKERSGRAAPLSEKVEKGRRLRLALLALRPRERSDIGTVKEALRKWRAEYTDEPAIYSAMKELGLGFTKRQRADPPS